MINKEDYASIRQQNTHLHVYRLCICMRPFMLQRLAEENNMVLWDDNDTAWYCDNDTV